jgi:hypothetical protein
VAKEKVFRGMRRVWPYNISFFEYILPGCARPRFTLVYFGEVLTISFNDFHLGSRARTCTISVEGLREAAAFAL